MAAMLRLCVAMLLLCACTPAKPTAPCNPAERTTAAGDETAAADWAERNSIDKLLSEWHAAAARADEAAYFSYLAEDAVFLGTDATERWLRDAFRAYAHPHFAKGKAWSFQATRRAIMVSNDGAIAWFDEDLTTPNLGPARGSGLLIKRNGSWKIQHYNLAVTVPNERFKEVKRLLETPKPPEAETVPEVPSAPPIAEPRDNAPGEDPLRL